MTEAEWLACSDPDKLLWFISAHPDADNLWRDRARPSERKWKLLGVGCCRRVWEQIIEEECRRVVEVVEAFVDGMATEVEVQRVAQAAVACGHKVHHDRCLHRAYSAIDALGRGVATGSTLEYSCLVAARHAAWAVMNERSKELKSQARLTRCIFGNHFRTVALDPSWRTEAVVALARGMYESRDFAPMPVLADALEDAGCADADILAHCRGDGPHVRGCWVVDLVLGKS